MSYTDIIYLGYITNCFCFGISLIISIISLFAFTNKVEFLSYRIMIKEIMVLLPKTERLKGLLAMFIPFSYILISLPYIIRLGYYKFNLVTYTKKEILMLVERYDLINVIEDKIKILKDDK